VSTVQKQQNADRALSCVQFAKIRQLLGTASNTHEHRLQGQLSQLWPHDVLWESLGLCPEFVHKRLIQILYGN
jgi:hypothetical protein